MLFLVLPKSYATIVEVWHITTPAGTYESLKRKLLDKYDQHIEKKLLDSLITLKVKASVNYAKQEQEESKPQNKNSKKRKGDLLDKRLCFVCKSSDHQKKDCPKWKERNAGKVKSGSSSNEKNGQNVHGERVDIRQAARDAIRK